MDPALLFAAIVITVTAVVILSFQTGLVGGKKEIKKAKKREKIRTTILAEIKSMESTLVDKNIDLSSPRDHRADLAESLRVCNSLVRDGQRSPDKLVAEFDILKDNYEKVLSGI